MKSELFFQILPLWKKALVPVALAILAALLGLALPQLPRFMIDEVIIKKSFDSLILVLGVFGFICILYAIVSHFLNLSFFKFQRENILHIQRDLINKLLYTEFEFFKKNHSGYLAQKIRVDVEGLANLFSTTILFGFVAIFQCVGALIILVKMNFILGCIALIPLPVLFCKIQREKLALREIAGEAMEVSSRVNEDLTEAFSTFEIAKGSGKEERTENKIVGSLENLVKIEVSKTKKESVFRYYIDGIIRVSEVLVWGGGAYLVIRQRISIGTLSAFIGYLLFIYDPLRALTMFLLAIEYGKKSLQRVQVIFNLIPEKGDKKIDRIESVKVQDASFWYEKGAYVFKDINISLARGHRLLITGPSGSGKSTFIRTLIGLLRHKDGDILWNEHSIDAVDKKELRKKIGYISQDVLLFQGSLYDNLTLGEPCQQEKIRSVLQMCRLTHLLDRNVGDNKSIKEHGMNLSAGERQRLALARILIKNPDLVILDEATANLDSETKKDINEIIMKNFVDCIIIKISHENIEADNGWQRLDLVKHRNEISFNANVALENN